MSPIQRKYKHDVQVTTRTTYLGVKITPQGFWSDMVNVHKHSGYLRTLDAEAWEPAVISWGCGGQDGSLPSIEAAVSFREALEIAEEHARALDKEYGGGIKPEIDGI